MFSVTGGLDVVASTNSQPFSTLYGLLASGELPSFDRLNMILQYVNVESIQISSKVVSTGTLSLNLINYVAELFRHSMLLHCMYVCLQDCTHILSFRWIEMARFEK